MNEIKVENKSPFRIVKYVFLIVVFSIALVYILYDIFVNFTEITVGIILFFVFGIPMVLIMLNRFTYYLAESYYTLSINGKTLNYKVANIFRSTFSAMDIKEVRYFNEPTIELITDENGNKKWVSSELILIIRNGFRRSILVSQRNAINSEYIIFKKRIKRVRTAKHRVYKTVFFSTLIYGTKY